ncbi:hypothetical protein KCU95_g3197, partial [Aureobasidium melanogenum]
MSDATFARLLSEVQEQPRCDDWGAKLQHVCDTLWSALDDKADDPGLADTLIAMLQQEDAFALARLVIPELRSKEPLVDSLLKQKVIDRTASQRMAALSLEATQQSDFDTNLYSEEKEVFTEAEMYRASLLLYGSAAFDNVEEQEIIQWLAQRPKKSTSKEQ